MKVAVCGLGRMGTAMAERLVAAGHDVATWNRSPGRSVAGAAAGTTPAEAARGADAVLLALLDGPASRDVLATLDAAPDTLVINVATIAPAESVEFAGTAAAAGLRYVEAPVLGSVPAVQGGTLLVLAGGSEADVAAAGEVLGAFAGEVRHAGELGTATGLKLVANSTLGVAAAGVRDALTLGDRLGLPQAAVLDVLAAGHFSKLVTAKRERLETGDHDGGDFTVAAVAKDLELVLAEADLPVVRAAALRAVEARDTGAGESDISALMAPSG
ncbi:NAD(P)-dependent oxidoreductase [Nocardioides speluncae]|uniref:NAD(P)-dependent oxidoreductase n=1 Tax=Nocardioides speluncae TaxID=2670337 RepID=UPI000D69CF03|nr:NAD(P)-dependent oxidoreductase [Nocardioides speluncae]